MRWFRRFRARQLRKAAVIAGKQAYLAMMHLHYDEAAAHLRQAGEYEQKATTLETA